MANNKNTHYEISLVNVSEENIKALFNNLIFQNNRLLTLKPKSFQARIDLSNYNKILRSGEFPKSLSIFKRTWDSFIPSNITRHFSLVTEGTETKAAPQTDDYYTDYEGNKIVQNDMVFVCTEKHGAIRVPVKRFTNGGVIVSLKNNKEFYLSKKDNHRILKV